MSPSRIAASVKPRIDITDFSWMRQAACQDTDPELFFPERGDTATAQQAKRICATCPVIDECFEYALFKEKSGVWGGTTGKDRRAIRKQRRIHILEEDFA